MFNSKVPIISLHTILQGSGAYINSYQKIFKGSSTDDLV